MRLARFIANAKALGLVGLAGSLMLTACGGSDDASGGGLSDVRMGDRTLSGLVAANAVTGDPGRGSKPATRRPQASAAPGFATVLTPAAAARSTAVAAGKPPSTGPREEVRLSPERRPLDYDQIALTLRRVGFECPQMVSAARVASAGGKGPVYRIACSSGSAYRGTVRRGRLVFRRGFLGGWSVVVPMGSHDGPQLAQRRPVLQRREPGAALPAAQRLLHHPRRADELGPGLGAGQERSLTDAS